MIFLYPYAWLAIGVLIITHIATSNPED